MPGYIAAVGPLLPYFLHGLVEPKLTVVFFLFLVRLVRGHTARSLPRRCEQLQQNRGNFPMLPIPLIASLGYYIAKFEASRGHDNGAATGLSFRCAPRLFFLPYRVRLVALVTLVPFFWSGVARNAIPASTAELTSSAAMAPSWSALAQGRSPSFLSEPFDLVPTAQITYPFGVI